jgi:phosphoserine phosphatase RsbU/P
MLASAPGLTADQVLQTFESEALTFFLGAAIAATGLVAAAFAAIRRQRVWLLIYFALFALLYGIRMWMQTRFANFLFDGSTAFFRMQTAINYVVPVPAFLFFDAAGFLSRKIRILTVSFFAVFVFLALATLIAGPSSLYQHTNNVLVIAALILLITEPMRGLAPDRDFIIARRGIFTFGAFALWDNLAIFLPYRLPRIEPFGFIALLASLGYVAAWQSMKRDEQLSEIKKELEVARRIQLSILPAEFPASGRFQIAARYIPMTSVAGDFYDFVVADDTRAGLLIADVSGHGVPAALIASMVKLAATSQRSHANDPAKVLLGMNSALHGNTQSQFVTAAYLYLDAQSPRISLFCRRAPTDVVVARREGRRDRRKRPDASRIRLRKIRRPRATAVPARSARSLHRRHRRSVQRSRGILRPGKSDEAVKGHDDFQRSPGRRSHHRLCTKVVEFSGRRSHRPRLRLCGVIMKFETCEESRASLEVVLALFTGVILGGARDLPQGYVVGRSLDPLVKARAFGMTPLWSIRNSN